jgi:CHAD domain-containing protein
MMKQKGKSMAYVFEIGESIPKGVKRIVLELIDTILKQLKDETNNRDKAIYESRKAFKQLRAILRLIRSDVGDKFFDKLNQFYRNQAEKLAPLRDAYVVIQALDKLMNEIEDEQVLATAKAIRKALNKRYKTVSRDLLKANGAVHDVVSSLESHRPSVEAWPLKRVKFKNVASDLEGIYSQGQKQRRIVAKSPTTEAYHDWRKAVKNLWYHIRLLEASKPEKLSPYAEKLKLLSDYLGDANDLAVLESFLAEHKGMQSEAGQAFLASLSAKQAALRASAKSLAKTLYKRESRKFIKEIKQSWKKWQATAP